MTVDDTIKQPVISTAQLSTRGQICIPEKVRKHLGLTEGTLFFVYAEDGYIILKTKE